MQTHYDAELKDTVRYLGKPAKQSKSIVRSGYTVLKRFVKAAEFYQGDANSEELRNSKNVCSDLFIGRIRTILELSNIVEQEYNAAMNVDASIDALLST